jgi:hypothetical protein
LKKTPKNDTKDVDLKIQPLKEKAIIVTPTGDGKLHLGHVKSIVDCYVHNDSKNLERLTCDGSVLQRNFNYLIRRAIDYKKDEDTNTRWLVIYHSDIEVVESNWLAAMVSIMEYRKFDVMALPMLIKSPSQNTSFSFEKEDMEWEYGAFTTDQLTQIKEQSSSFFDDPHLLYNTGVMVIDMDSKAFKKMVKKSDGIYFRIDEGISPTGKTGMLSEDWYFSKLLRDAGANMKLYCDLTTVHYGGVGWILKNGVAGMCSMPGGWVLPLKPLRRTPHGEGMTYGKQLPEGSVPPKKK